MSSDVTNISEVVRVFVNQLQQAETASQGVLFLQRLANANGVQLDGMGEIVGEPRNARNDTDYRDAILFRIFLNNGNGEPETLISAVREFTLSDLIRYRDIFPAGVHIELNGNAISVRFFDLIQSLAPAAVQIVMTQTFDPAFIFAENDYTPPDSDGLGFGDNVDLTLGGKLSSAIM